MFSDTCSNKERGKCQHWRTFW